MAPSVAARTAGSGKRWLPGQLPHAAASATTGAGSFDGGTGDLIGLKVEIFVDSAWTDITAYVRRGSGITITRGRADETSQIQPQTARLALDNRDGRFAARNPTGPYYGQLGRNVPLRVSRLNNGVRRYRFYGEVPNWPTASDITGKDKTVAITASGMLRRLRAGNQPLRSPMFRAFTIGYTTASYIADPTLTPVAYWPCEDGANAAQIASGLPGGASMTVTGTPTFVSNTAFPGSAALPQLNGSAWSGTVPPLTGAGANSLTLLVQVPADGDNNNSVIARLVTAGTVARIDLVYTTAAGGTITGYGYSASGTQLFDTTTFPMTNLGGVAVMLSITLTADVTPGSLFWSTFLLSVDPTGPSYIGIGIVSGTIGVATQVSINPDGRLGGTSVGHVAYQTGFDTTEILSDAMLGNASDSPTLRYMNLCTEQAVPALVLTSVASTGPGDETTMGVQGIDTFGNLLQQCADALFAPMFEARDQLSLVLRTKATMYNQAAKVTLDVAQHHLSGPLVPQDDDQLTRNDVTVSRTNGSSYKLALTTGAMSTLPPPDGIGPYPYSYDLSLGEDALLPDQAGWRLHHGTVNEPRYPAVPVNLRRLSGNLDLVNALLTVDIGDRLDITNPPSPDFAPDPISQIVQGYTETLSNFEHDIVFNCSPASPWNVGYTDDPVYGHADTDGSTLVGDYPLGTEVTLRVATTGAATGSPLWTTSAGDFPFDIAVGGERMTVTNITGASSPQTFTVIRSVNTVVKSQTSDTDVRLWQPMYTSV